MFDKDPKRFQNGTLNTLNYKHPKYAYYKHDPNNVYKVIGFFYNLNKYRIQNTADPSKVIYADPYDVSGIWGRESNESLKKKYG